jgi:FOG: TPR repeat, SEL1 subfamily
MFVSSVFPAPSRHARSGVVAPRRRLTHRINARAILSTLMLLASLLCAAVAHAMTPAEAALIDNAAHKGSASAQVLLAVVYLNGMAGYPKNEALAAHWFERSAELGNDYAQKILGDLYAEGRGVARNPQLAADWREKAANRGNVQAQFLLGKMYYDGEGVPHDTVKADYWLSRAATEGNSAEAQFWLSKLHQAGNTTSTAAASGDNLLAQSAARGYDDAVQLVRLLEEFGYQVREGLYKRPPELAKLAADGTPTRNTSSAKPTKPAATVTPSMARVPSNG